MAGRRGGWNAWKRGGTKAGRRGRYEAMKLGSLKAGRPEGDKDGKL
jgi:hypothetical protein